MKNINFTVLFFLTTLLFSCGNDENTPEVDEDGIITGLQTKTFSHDNINRNYLIYIPDSYDSEIKYPLMFNFQDRKSVG